MAGQHLAQPEPQDYRLIIGYLLGDLSAEEQQRVEDRYFADPDFLEQIEAVEGDLMIDYARNVLPQDEAAKLEGQLFTSAYQRQKVEAAKALLVSMGQAKEWVQPLPSRRQTIGSSWRLAVHRSLRGVISPRRISFAVVTAVLVFVGGWLITKTLRLQGQIETLQAEQIAIRQQAQVLQTFLAQEQMQANQSTANPPPENTVPQRSAPNDWLAATLSATSDRSSGQLPKQLTLMPETKTIQLTLNYDGDADLRYRAILETYNGEHVLTKTGLRVHRSNSNKIVLVSIPARPLTNQTYVLRLRADANDAEADLCRYSFRVRRK